MAVSKRSYRVYDGAMSPGSARPLVLMRYAFQQLFSTRAPVILCVLALVPTVIQLIFVYLANSEAVRAMLQIRGTLVSIDELFFLRCMIGQGWVAMVLTAYLGPSLIANDLAHNALPLYFSRPLTRTQYVLGKAAVLGVILSGATWIPLSLVFLLQCSLVPGWIPGHYWIVASIFFSSMVWIAFLALLALAISAWVKWRVIATVATFAVFILPSGFGEVINGTLGTNWGKIFNLNYLATVIWHTFFRVQLQLSRVTNNVRIERLASSNDLPPEVALVALLAVTALCLVMLNKRLRAREVVR